MTPARLSILDLIRTGTFGLTTRPLRVVLSALGIAVGVAAMVSVLGVSASGQAELDRTLARLGTNLLTLTPGRELYGGQATLPVDAPRTISRIREVQRTAALGRLDVAVYRHDRMPAGQTGSIAVFATQPGLIETLNATIHSGQWLSAATGSLPVVVLGATAAERLGIVGPGPRVWLGGQWFGVTGILDPVPLAPELDASALVGWPIARDRLGFDEHPTTLFTRIEDSAVEHVRARLALTANPAHPEEVRVSRPSDALVARQATGRTLTTILAALGGLAVLVGGFGVANTMVIAVVERRAEIGLRRALGATRAHIRRQFLAESVVLAGLGGIGGVATGIIITAGYTAAHQWPAVVPWWATLGGVGLTAVIGTLAGAYPASRAADLSPSVALA